MRFQSLCRRTELLSAVFFGLVYLCCLVDLVANSQFDPLSDAPHAVATAPETPDDASPVVMMQPGGLRQLQRDSSSTSTEQQERGRTVLTFLYLSVLGMCFMTPILYYCRLHCEERAVRRRLQALEAQGLEAALSQSNNLNTNSLAEIVTTNNNLIEESRAARRKYIEERRARILQLFAPVRMILTEENFPSGPGNTPRIPKDDEAVTTGEEGAASVSAADADDKPGEAVKMEGGDLDEEDEENLLVEIPVPGLHVDQPQALRLASGICTICLCAFTVGSDVVWSSNASCEHVFHEECIEKWLMKQREGPLCPCCRRDFIVDPFDVVDEEADENAPPLPDPLMDEEAMAETGTNLVSSSHTPNSPEQPLDSAEQRA